MDIAPLARADINLLVAFEALMHERRTADPRHRFLRAAVVETAGDLGAALAAVKAESP